MKVCERCGGTGRFMGQGFMMQDCTLCEEDNIIKAPELDKIDRRSKSYKTAIDDIMKSDPKLSKKEATKLFDKAYENG